MAVRKRMPEKPNFLGGLQRWMRKIAAEREIRKIKRDAKKGQKRTRDIAGIVEKLKAYKHGEPFPIELAKAMDSLVGRKSNDSRSLVRLVNETRPTRKRDKALSSKLEVHRWLNEFRRGRLAEDYQLERRVKQNPSYKGPERRVLYFFGRPQRDVRFVKYGGKFYKISFAPENPLEMMDSMDRGNFGHPLPSGTHGPITIKRIGRLEGERLVEVSRKEAERVIKKGKTVSAFPPDLSVGNIQPAQTKSLSERLKQNEQAEFGLREKIMAAWYRHRPSLRLGRGTSKYGFVVDSPKEFASVIRTMALDQVGTKFRNRVVVTVAGYRGAGKTTALKAIEEAFVRGTAGDALKPGFIEMDAYFKEKPQEAGASSAVSIPRDPLLAKLAKDRSRAPGGWDNPRNSHIDLLAKAIRDFKRGKVIKVPVGRVPRHGAIQMREINPHKTNVLVIEGIHASNLKIAKLSDVRGFIYIPPGLQIIRTWVRDLDLSKRDRAAKMPPEYYTGINTRVREWHNRFILSRMKDADVVYEMKWSKRDVERLSGMLGVDGEMTRRLLAGWGIPYE